MLEHIHVARVFGLQELHFEVSVFLFEEVALGDEFVDFGLGFLGEFGGFLDRGGFEAFGRLLLELQETVAQVDGLGLVLGEDGVLENIEVLFLFFGKVVGEKILNLGF